MVTCLGVRPSTPASCTASLCEDCAQHWRGVRHCCERHHLRTRPPAPSAPKKPRLAANPTPRGRAPLRAPRTPPSQPPVAKRPCRGRPAGRRAPGPLTGFPKPRWKRQAPPRMTQGLTRPPHPSPPDLGWATPCGARRARDPPRRRANLLWGPMQLLDLLCSAEPPKSMS